MSPPIWWIRWSVFLRLFLRGERSYILRPFDRTMSWWIAGVIAETCREIREGR